MFRVNQQRFLEYQNKIKERNDKIRKHNEKIRELNKDRKLRNEYHNKNLHPITFSFPSCKISEKIEEKTKLISNLIPGESSTYIYNNENDYYNEYKVSFFAKTIKKGGWDCLRHYEIIANCCIPYFPDIENCPNNTLSLFSKPLLLEGNMLYEKYKNYDINKMTEYEINECTTLINKNLEYAKNVLTTQKMAEYILTKTNNITCSKILFLSGDTNPDYLRCLTLHGFKSILGSNCHDYPIVTHLYKSNNMEYSKLYGKGITYTNLLDRNLHNDDFDNTLEENIKNKEYDLILYGNFHRGTPFLNLVIENYSSDKVIFLCGEDIDGCKHESHIDLLNKGFSVFVREL